MLKVIFLVIFFCALPFNIYPLKIATLNIKEELFGRRVSKSLRRRLEEAQINDEDHYNSLKNMTKDTFADDKNIEDVVDEKTHTIVVLTLMVLISSLSMFVKDLTIVYSIIAAFSESFINFILAGLFLICTENT